jgi:pyruvate dehydrogenase E1 component beta subunit
MADTAAATEAPVKEMRMQEALREALRAEMARDERVFVMGEDVALFGGAYGVTRGLIQEFGEKRVLDTPISESALVGLAVGAAINGMRPVVEIQFADLLPLAMDQLAVACGALSLYDRRPSECSHGDTHQVRHPCRRRTEPLEL